MDYVWIIMTFIFFILFLTKKGDSQSSSFSNYTYSKLTDFPFNLDMNSHYSCTSVTFDATERRLYTLTDIPENYLLYVWFTNTEAQLSFPMGQVMGIESPNQPPYTFNISSVSDYVVLEPLDISENLSVTDGKIVFTVNVNENTYPDQLALCISDQ